MKLLIKGWSNADQKNLYLYKDIKLKSDKFICIDHCGVCIWLTDRNYFYNNKTNKVSYKTSKIGKTDSKHFMAYGEFKGFLIPLRSYMFNKDFNSTINAEVGCIIISCAETFAKMVNEDNQISINNFLKNWE